MVTNNSLLLYLKVAGRDAKILMREATHCSDNEAVIPAYMTSQTHKFSFLALHKRW